jgi:hypothetical protein
MKGAYVLKESKPRITWIGVVLIFIVCIVIAGFSKPLVRGSSTEKKDIEETYDFELIHFTDNFDNFISKLHNQDLWQY